MPGPSFVCLNYIFDTYILLTLNHPAKIKYATSERKSYRVRLLMAMIGKIIPLQLRGCGKVEKNNPKIDNEAHVPPRIFRSLILSYPYPVQKFFYRRASSNPSLKLEPCIF